MRAIRTVATITDSAVVVRLPAGVPQGPVEIIILVPEDADAGDPTVVAMRAAAHAERAREEGRELLSAAEEHARGILEDAEETRAEAARLLQQAEDAVWKLLTQANHQRAAVERTSRRRTPAVAPAPQAARAPASAMVVDAAEVVDLAEGLDSLTSLLGSLLGGE